MESLVWEAWDKGEIDDQVAWWLLAIKHRNVSDMADEQISAELRQILGIDDDADVHPAPKVEQ